VLDPNKPDSVAEARLFADEYWNTFLKREKRKRRWRGYFFRLFMVFVWMGVPMLVMLVLDYVHK